jgi:hypothetical protein
MKKIMLVLVALMLAAFPATAYAGDNNPNSFELLTVGIRTMGASAMSAPTKSISNQMESGILRLCLRRARALTLSSVPGPGIAILIYTVWISSSRQRNNTAVWGLRPSMFCHNQ